MNGALDRSSILLVSTKKDLRMQVLLLCPQLVLPLSFFLCHWVPLMLQLHTVSIEELLMARKIYLFRIFPMLMITLILAVQGCQLLPQEYDPRQAPVRESVSGPVFDTFEVERGDLRLTDTIHFRYEPLRTAALSFDIGGLRLETLYVDTGDAVTEGQLLAELEGGSEASQITRLEEALELADLRLEQLREDHAYYLESEGLWLDALAATETEREEAISNLLAQQEEELNFHEAERHILSLELQDTRERFTARQIFAPFDGIVTYVRIRNVGENVRKDESIVHISDNSVSLFVGRIPEPDYFDAGMQWDLVSNDIIYPIEIINPADYGIEGEEGLAYARLLIDDVVLESETRGSVEVVLAESLDTLYVPRRSVFVAGGQSMVYVENPDGVRVAAEVETGLETREFAEILSGLSAGEVIIRD